VGSGTVFLVEDDAGVLRALSRLLGEADFNVQSFQSAEDFLIHHDTKTLGCAVFDIGLGAYSGLDLLHVLARKGQMRPIVFISGRGDIATSVRAMKSGAIDFLTKPVQETDLIQAVRIGIERDRNDRERGAKLAARSRTASKRASGRNFGDSGDSRLRTLDPGQRLSGVPSLPVRKSRVNAGNDN
jgi:FixJ family two-component response regulator